MTAEIVIMNKIAVALAADSAVTIKTSEGPKIYNTNKLFMLSKYRPVGVMIYGNAELMNVPWESIIKIYRNKLGKQKFDTLKGYAKHFIDFFDKSNSLFPESEQEKYFYGSIVAYFNVIKDEIDKEVKSIIEQKGKIDNTEIGEIVSNKIKIHYEVWMKYDTLPSVSGENILELTTKYSDAIKRAKEQIFEKLPVSEISLGQLETIGIFLFSKNRFPNNTSGVVVAGFGEKDTFPSINSFIIEAVINNKLKYKEDEDKSVEISFSNSATIIPFAQSEMVATFMEGIDPFYNSALEGYLSELFDKYPNHIADAAPKLSENEKKGLVEKLRKLGNDLLDDFKKKMKIYERRYHINPIIDIVAVLPKDELAAMAESLVNLTSFKRKISPELETVGGPIDVALISKGDGLIWIKRKHYFNPELNAHFFANYYRED